MAKTLQTFARCVIFSMTVDYLSCILVTFSTSICAFRRFWAYFQLVYRSTLQNASYSFLPVANWYIP